ncbi:putative holin-like toxin [Bacillus sp. FSL K6-6540]
MEVKDALSLMFMFGMFILALLTYMKKKQTALPKVTVYFDHHLAADCSLCSYCA